MARSRLNQLTSLFIFAKLFRLGINKGLPLILFNRKVQTILLTTFLVFIQFNIVGCMLPLLTPAPSVFEKPFKEETKASIKVGVTTKEEVSNMLGSPDAIRGNGSIYIYAKPYIYMKFFLFAGLSHGSGRDFQNSHLLIVQFDKDGVVKNFDHIAGDHGKTQNGIYVADAGLRASVSKFYGTVYTPAYAPISQMLVLYSPVDIEQRAKEFWIPDGKSAIYVYREPSYFDWLLPENAIVKVSLRLNGTHLGDFGPEGFFCLIVDPGPHTLMTQPIFPDTSKYRSDILSLEISIGEIVFIEQSWEWKLWENVGYAHLGRVADTDEAHREIEKRRMIIDCLTLPE